MKNIIISVSFLLLSGCASHIESLNPVVDAADPTERGLGYVAGAIVVAAIIRAIGNE